jgi:hypothetical protein
MSYNNIGDVYRSREDLPAALKAYQGALVTIEWLAKTDAGDPAWLHLLGLSHTNIGDVHLESHDLSAALAAYTAARAALSAPGGATGGKIKAWPAALRPAHRPT